MAKLWVFVKEIIAPCLFVMLISQVVRLPSVTQYLDGFHQPGWQVSTQHRVEQQQLHWLAVKQQINSPSILFVGSSSVFNGVDPKIIQSHFDPVITPFNLGATNLLGYELYLLQEYLLSDHTQTVVYLYNTFSFTDSFHPQSSSTRWGLGQGIALSMSHPSLEGIQSAADGTISQLFPIVQFRHIIRDYLIKNSKHTLEHSPSWLDYPSDDTTNLEGITTWNAPTSPWLQKAYKDSLMMNNLSYSALKDFIKVAHKQHIRMILIPIPEPHFNQEDVLEQKRIVDNHVKTLAIINGAQFIDREHFNEIEQDLELFRDYLHLTLKGRQVYSHKLAQIIKSEGL